VDTGGVKYHKNKGYSQAESAAQQGKPEGGSETPEE
jgi:hypothetical protein